MHIVKIVRSNRKLSMSALSAYIDAIYYISGYVPQHPAIEWEFSRTNEDKHSGV